MNKILPIKFKYLLLGVSVIFLGVSFYLFAAWQEPGQEAPEGNVNTPINTGSLPQSKTGRISATEFYDTNDPNYYLNPNGDSKLSGNLNVGNTTIKGDGTISANLNADKLDDLHAADLLAQGTGKGIYSLKCGIKVFPMCYHPTVGPTMPSEACTPLSCASGDVSLGTGCVYNYAEYVSSDVISTLNCQPRGFYLYPWSFAGYCERICRDE